MKLIVTISYIFIITTVTSVMFASDISKTSFQQADKAIPHKVEKGETVYSIAKKYNVSITEIYMLNPNAMEGIKVGTILNIPPPSQAPTGSVTTYNVKNGETLYSIAKLYGIKVDDIINANPELKTRPLSEGQTLRIPSSSNSNQSSVFTVPYNPPSNSRFISHTVAAKETIYGISKKYNIGSDAIIDFNPNLKDGLKEGMTIIIPVLDSSANSKNTLQNTNKISIGIVLPFNNKSNSKTARFVEYYEGLLLALKEMKVKGFSANIYVFDIGSESETEKLGSLLETYEMKYLDLIIGGVSPEQIAIISDFARKQGIKYAIPFPTKANNTENNPFIFQINSPHSMLYENVAKTFTNQFPNTNVIYITENGSNEGRNEFISALNNELPRAGMIANKIERNSSLKENLIALLDSNRKNIIIPTSASKKALQQILPVLRTIKNQHTNIIISLFGHTDWQTYTQYKDEFAEYDTYIYTPFFLSENDLRVTHFFADYKKWYDNKSLINTYPRYGALGYDTGISFFTALWKYGKNFDSNTNSLAGSSIQAPFLFKKLNVSGGYMNTGFYLIHYKEDGTIEKTEYGR